MKNLLRALLLASVLACPLVEARAVAYPLVQITTGTLQQGTTWGFYVSSGTCQQFTATASTMTALIVTGTGTFSGGFSAKGTSTNDDAPAGFIGEFISSYTTVLSTYAATGVFQDSAKITLTPGNWRLDGTILATLNGATFSGGSFGGISSTAGNSFPDLDTTQCYFEGAPPVAAEDQSYNTSACYKKVSATTIYYLKLRASYSVAIPKYKSGLVAIRAR